MRSKSFKHTAVTNWLDMVESKCPACGDFIDYCQGHGEIGDPEGYAIIKQQEETTCASCNFPEWWADNCCETCSETIT